jgi:hypothetical protein
MLRHAHADMPEMAAQFVLACHGVSREQLQDLPLPVSFLYAHLTLCVIMQRTA